MRKHTLYILLLLLPVMAMAGVNYEKMLRKQPGNSNLYCAWIGQLLQEGDTAAAEEKIGYLKKMNTPAPCVLIRQAEIAYNRGRSSAAALYYADAICSGYEVEGDTLLAALCTLHRSTLLTKLRHALPTTTHKKEVEDAIMVINAQGGEVNLNLNLNLNPNENENENEKQDTILHTIHYQRIGNKREVFAKINGLRIKLVLDSTANEPTISGVETQFLRKNDYIKAADVLDNRRELVLRTLDFGNNLVLEKVRVNYARNQEDPLIIPISLFEAFGRVELDDNNEVVRVVKREP